MEFKQLRKISFKSFGNERNHRHTWRTLLCTISSCLCTESSNIWECFHVHSRFRSQLSSATWLARQKEAKETLEEVAARDKGRGETFKANGKGSHQDTSETGSGQSMLSSAIRCLGKEYQRRIPLTELYVNGAASCETEVSGKRSSKGIVKKFMWFLRRRFEEQKKIMRNKTGWQTFHRRRESG